MDNGLYNCSKCGQDYFVKYGIESDVWRVVCNDCSKKERDVAQNAIDWAIEHYKLHPFGDGISISTDLGRERLNELGRKSPYFRCVTIKCSCGNIDEVVMIEKGEVRAFRCFMGCGEIAYAFGSDDMNWDVVEDYYNDVITIPSEGVDAYVMPKPEDIRIIG